jgi:hypothetical protein
LKLDPSLERDTRGVPGSPDIAATIFDKIKRADIFVGVVSFINPEAGGRLTPTRNIEVGAIIRSERFAERLAQDFEALAEAKVLKRLH